MPEAARMTDLHICTIHGAGPVSSGAGTVLIEGLPAARKCDTALCPGAVDGIIEGEPTVLFEGRSAARKGDKTDGGVIVRGSTTVFIGLSRQNAALMKASENGMPFVEVCP